MSNTLHEQLIAQGYAHFHYDAETVDVGNGETGPMVHHSEAYDEYVKGDERIFAQDGVERHREKFDPEFEAFMSGQSLEAQRLEAEAQAKFDDNVRRLGSPEG